MVAKPLCPLYKNIIKPLDRVRYPELRYYLIDGEQVVIMGIVHVKRSPQAVTSMIKRFLEEYDK